MTEFSKNLFEIDKTFSRIFEQFQCPICFEEFKKTFMTTKCSHRFCEECIKETIRQNGKCPLCNKILNNQDLVRDHNFDCLLEDFKILKEKKIQNLFDRLSDKQVNIDVEFSPIQSVLKNHVIKTLTIHEDYLSVLKSNYENEVKRIENRTEKEISMIEKSSSENSEKIEKIKKDSEKKIEKLNKEFHHQIDSIAKRYQIFLEANEKSLLAIPTKIKFRLFEKNIKLDGFEIKPTDDISVIFNYLKEESEKQLHDPIINFPDNLIILNFGPFSTHSNDEMNTIFEEYKRNETLPQSIQIIRTHNCLPITEYNISWKLFSC